MTPIRQKLLSAVAGQLGRPHGLLGPLVANFLNRGNGKAIADAVEAAEAQPAATVADVGFGGGIGLRLLLERVGEGGTVYGVEVADDMLRRARTGFRREIQAGRLHLMEGSLTSLPFDDASLDAVITLNTVYFVGDLDTACRELTRAVRPGGRVVVGIGDPDVMRNLPFTRYGFTLRPVTEIAAALANSGLTVEQRRIEDKPMPRYVFVGRRD